MLKKSNEYGQTLVEFAIILPLLILILLGIAELGWYFVARMTLKNAAVTGAEFAVSESITDPVEIEFSVRESAEGMKLGDDDVTVVIASEQKDGNIVPKYVSVEVAYTYRPLVTGNLFRRRVTIRASAIRYYVQPEKKNDEGSLGTNIDYRLTDQVSS